MKRYLHILTCSLCILLGVAFAWAFSPQSYIQVATSAMAASFYQTIQQAGSAVAQEPILNFPSNMTCVDDPANTRTNCTPSGSSGGDTFAPPYVTPDGTNFYAPVFKIAKLVNANYSWINQGSATVTVESSGVINMSVPGDNALHGRYTTSYPSTPFGIEFHSTYTGPPGSVSEETALFFTDGTKFVTWGAFWNGSSMFVDSSHWSNGSTFTGGDFQAGTTFAMLQGIGFHLAACDDGTTNFTFGHSADGIHWIKDYTEARTAFLTPSGIGFLGYLSSSGPAQLIADNWTQTTCPF